MKPKAQSIGERGGAYAANGKDKALKYFFDDVKKAAHITSLSQTFVVRRTNRAKRYKEQHKADGNCRHAYIPFAFTCHYRSSFLL